MTMSREDILAAVNLAYKAANDVVRMPVLKHTCKQCAACAWRETSEGQEWDAVFHRVFGELIDEGDGDVWEMEEAQVKRLVKEHIRNGVIVRHSGRLMWRARGKRWAPVEWKRRSAKRGGSSRRWARARLAEMTGKQLVIERRSMSVESTRYKE